jgi:ATP/maltotriose-dependent transcriptional regulator MalT
MLDRCNGHQRRAGSDYSPVACAAAIPGPVVATGGIWRILRVIVRARFALINMRLEDASRCLSQLKMLLSNFYREDLIHTVCVLEASLLLLREDFANARQALKKLPSSESNALAVTLLRYADWKLNERGDVAAPDTVDYLAFPIGGKAVGRILSQCVSAAIAFDRLQLTMSSNLATEALQLARARYGHRSPTTSFPITLLARVAYEQGRLDEAEALLRSNLATIRASGMLECVVRATVILARISLHRGQRGLALSTLREMETWGRTRRRPALVLKASSEYRRLLAAIHSDEGKPLEPHPRKEQAMLERRVRVCLSSTHSEASDTAAQVTHSSLSRDVLSRLQIGVPPRAEAPSYALVERSLQNACAAASCGSIAHSYALLIVCLQIGATRGLHMAFIDAGHRLRTLLEHIYSALPKDDPNQSDLRPYIATLLRVTIQSDDTKVSPTTYRPLSRRETGILRMIAHGMSNKRIAQSLGIAPETVKSHAKSIFVKLATRSRAHAVARAEAIGLLS